LPVCGLNPALEYGFYLAHFSLGQLLVQVEHSLDQFDDTFMAGFVNRVGEVDGTDGESFEINDFNLHLHVLRSL
jgi:hypothetical protein